MSCSGALGVCLGLAGTWVCELRLNYWCIQETRPSRLGRLRVLDQLCSLVGQGSLLATIIIFVRSDLLMLCFQASL